MLSILKKPKADITLDIGGEPFYPGSTINVGAFISSQDKFPMRSGTVEITCTEVYWHMVSNGKTTSNQKAKRKLYKFKQEFLGSTKFTSGMALSESTSVTIPTDMPPTITGKTVNISWQLDIKLDIAGMRDIHEKRILTVLPMPIGTPVSESGNQYLENKATDFSDEGELTLSLNADHGAAGETLRGSFEAIIRNDLSVQGIRVELEVKESAGTKSSKTAADLVQLEEKTTLTNGAYKQWKFELKIPDRPLPSFVQSSSKVVWCIKGILDKRGKKDFSVIYPIQVF